MRQAIVEFKEIKTRYKPFVDDSFGLGDFGKAEIAEAEKQVLRGQTTKFEALVLRAIMATSDADKQKQAIKKITDKATIDFSLTVLLQIWAEIQRIMGGALTKGGAAIKGSANKTT